MYKRKLGVCQCDLKKISFAIRERCLALLRINEKVRILGSRLRLYSYTCSISFQLKIAIFKDFIIHTMTVPSNLNNQQANISSDENVLYYVPISISIILQALSNNMSLSIFKSIYFSSNAKGGIGVGEIRMIKTKKLINRKISRLIKAGLVAMNEHEDEDCRYYYVTSLGRRVYELQKLVEDALDIEPALKRIDNYIS